MAETVPVGVDVGRTFTDVVIVDTLVMRIAPDASSASCSPPRQRRAPLVIAGHPHQGGSP